MVGEVKITTWTAQVAADHIVLSPYFGDDFGCEGFRTFGLASVANGGGSSACGEGFCVKNLALVEVEVFVGDVIAKVANNISFDRMGRCTPFVGGGGKYIEAAWMRETKYLCLEFFGSLGGLGIELSILMWFRGGGNVHGEWNEGRTGLRGISGSRDGGGKEVVRHGFGVFVCGFFVEESR